MLTPAVLRRSVLGSVALLTLLGATACGEDESDPKEPDDEAVASSASAVTSARGVDYSFARPSPSSTRDDGYKFVARYLSGDPGSGKDITKSEADSLISAGLKVVVVWETFGTEAQDGYDQGVRDAKAAKEEAASIGQPTDRPIYFAIDFDPTGYESDIASYFDGVNSVIGVARTGAYGGYGAIESLFGSHKISYGWQAYAWSDGDWDKRAQVRQTENGIDGGQEDLDESEADDYGQWPYTSSSSATPPKKSPPAADSATPLETPGVGTNKDGDLAVFTLGLDGVPAHNWQKVAGGAWSGWDGLGGKLLSDIAVGENADGRLELFGVGTNGAMYHDYQTSPGGDWSGWKSLGGKFTSNVSVARNAEGRLEVFGRGANDALYHAWQQAEGGWSDWSSLGGVLTSDPTVAVNADGRLEVFARGSHDVPYHVWQKAVGGAWSDWDSLGGALSTDMSVTVNEDGRLEAFAVGTNHKGYHAWQKTPGGAWSGWDSLGGDLTSNMAAVKNKDGKLEVFARGTNDAIFHAEQKTAGGGWTGWESLGGEVTSNPSVGINEDGRLEVFARGTTGALYHIWQKTTDGSWSAWGDLGGKIE